MFPSMKRLGAHPPIEPARDRGTLQRARGECGDGPWMRARCGVSTLSSGSSAERMPGDDCLLVSDVPLGVFLSSGVDSSSVLAQFREVCKAR